jgi:hypothetical protein
MARCLFSDTFLGTNRLADALSVLWSPLQRLENHQVERPLKQLNPILIAILLSSLCLKSFRFGNVSA